MTALLRHFLSYCLIKSLLKVLQEYSILEELRIYTRQRGKLFSPFSGFSTTCFDLQILPPFADYSSVVDFTYRSRYHRVTEVVLLRLKDEGRINISTPKNCGGLIDKYVCF